MPKGKTVVVVLASALLALALVPFLLFRSEPEPTYKDHTLSEWIDRAGTNQEARAAIRQIGTNALPIILEWLRYEPHHWTDKEVQFLGKLPGFVRRSRLLEYINSPPGRRRVDGAVFVLTVLGPEARPIAPELLRLSTNSALPKVSYRAMETLGRLGTNGIPELLSILQDKSHPHRRVAPLFLDDAMVGDPCAASTVPVLVQCVVEPNPDPELVLHAATVLGGDGRLDLQPYKPAFQKLLTHTNSLIRLAATNLLWSIEYESATNTPAP